MTMPEEINCPSCHEHFLQLRPTITGVVVSKHFEKEMPGFDPNLILDTRHEYFTHLHKFEEHLSGNHIFRALKDGRHIVYAVDKKHRLILLRAFKNVKEYEKYLDDKKSILGAIEKASSPTEI